MAPLQLYSSGLVFAPQEALIRTKFSRELPDWLYRAPRVEEDWSPELQTLEGHSSLVWSITFSPDGRLLASGSGDRTIKLWDPATGALKQTLEGHSDSVQSVAFSPDCRLLASGSSDETIKLWDPATGGLKQTLESHSDSVQSVAFSPGGRLLASGSSDRTIKLWDPATGGLKQTLEGHSGSVQSVAFSPDGRLLASGSSDRTIMLWDPATGALKQTLEGHSGWVWSIAFSPDGRLLASGSDETIMLWDPATGALKQTLEGHSSWVQSVSTDSIITNIEFSKQLPQLITNMGFFDIQVCYESLPSNPSEKVAKVSLAGRWVTIQGQRELWLPPDYQPCSSIAKSGTIAVGCTNGRVIIIMFSVT
jgi:WD40 repeat protein